MITTRTAAPAPLLLLFLTGCNAGLARQPIVDMAGVDPVAYNRDAAECANIAEHTWFELGNAATNCMAKKGYKILYGY